MLFIFVRVLILVLLIGASIAPLAASAHEVYVLTPHEIATAVAAPSFDEVTVALSDFTQFMFWAILALITVTFVFFISVLRRVERQFVPKLIRLRRYAPAIARITIGLSFIASCMFGATFGPELPLIQTFGSWSTVIDVLLGVIGVAIFLDWYTRLASLVGLMIFGAVTAAKGLYMLTYANYVGELLVMALFGAHHGLRFLKRSSFSLVRSIDRVTARYAPLAFLIARVAFGISIVFASVYAKVLHNHLALAVIYHYPALQHFFGLEPHFLVMGAAIVECVVGMFFILGIELRFAVLFLEFWLILSMWYFGESVWPHVVLLGIPIAIFCYGYDEFTLEGRYFKKGNREPVL